MNITTGKILKYSVLPGILPRIKEFFTSGFSCISFYMAHVYRAVKLLPADHPYLHPSNAGRYGIRHVIFEAQRNLVFKKENTDQIVIFFTLLTGMVLLFLQFALLLMNFIVPIAAAGPLGQEIQDYNNLIHFFVINDEHTRYDIAYRLLDLTFGFEDPYAIFNSCAIRGEQCQLAFLFGNYTPIGPVYDLPTAFHLALHTLFHFYNYGVLVIAFMIGGYMVVTVVGETAQSGTPFGKRFNGMWAPIRLVVAIALLTPLAFGMNGAQLMTLMMAKWGSNMATNGWQEFMFDTSYIPLHQDQDPIVAGESYVARPKAPTINSLIEFTFVAQTCKWMEYYVNRRGNGKGPEIQAWEVYDPPGPAPPQAQLFDGTDYFGALDRANFNDIVIRFGVQDPANFDDYLGGVKPICGEIILPTKGVDDLTQLGAYEMQQSYYEILFFLWDDAINDQRAQAVARRYTPTVEKDPNAGPLPNLAFVNSTADYYNFLVSDAAEQARARQVTVQWSEDFTILGWAGAGIWYQKIAEFTGSYFSSVYGIPTASKYPAVMEYVKNQRRIHNDFVQGQERFHPVLSNGNDIEWGDKREQTMAIAYYYAQQFWWPTYAETSSNTFKDTITSVFGLGGLFDMQEQTDIHPLAQLVGVGRALVESAVTNLGFSFGGGAIGGIAKILGRDLVGSVALAASSFAGQIAMIGLSIGFILYYIIPFLPFIYFFFAAGGWIKGIFEAMVGLPLWAMAHIRIDGEGLPGPAAMNGYFLIFEIFIRPLLIIFGLVASIAIFTAQVQVLNEIWQVVTSNIMGFDPETAKAVGAGTGMGVGPDAGSIEWLRTKADELFFTVIYAIIVYMLAMSSFKLIDLIPNNILRWIGTSVSTFGEQSGDPAATLVQYSYMGSQMALGPINQGFAGIAARARPGS